MNCPSCKAQISEKDLICPHCKKVLQLKCKNCGQITKNTVCEKCGAVLLNKCYKCGKLNSTDLDVCPKCGLNVNASIGLRESVIEEFAVLTLEITNFDDLKNALKSEKLTEQFKKNLYTLIKKNAMQKKLRVQFWDNTFIVRFCKDYSFQESCVSALDFSIFIAQTVTEINAKLFDAKGITLKAQMAIQKRDVYSKPEEYKSGININVVYSSSGVSHLFNNIEVVVDSYIYQVAKNDYPFQSLSAVYVKNQMVMFFELVLHKLIKINKEKKLDVEKMELPQSAQFEPLDDPEDENLIDFTSLHCSFWRAKGENLLERLKDIHSQNLKNPIVSIKADKIYNTLSNIPSDILQSIFDDYKIVRFSCSKNNMYSIYGLLKQMFLVYKNTLEFDVLKDPIVADALTVDENILRLLSLSAPSHVHPEDLKFSYYEAFSLFLRGIPYKTLFVIEDFENADETSIEIIKYLLENDELGDVGFIVSNDSSYSLHRKIYKLMTSANYFEIEMKASSNKVVFAENLDKLKNIQKTFFLEKILENTKGSRLYFTQAIEYLLDDEILGVKNGKYIINQDRMIVLPKDIDELVQKRIEHLIYFENAYDLFGALLLLGEKCSVQIAHSLGYSNDIDVIKYLDKHNFVNIIDDKIISINNYNLYRSNFIESCKEDKLELISNKLLETVYAKISQPNNVKAEIMEFAKLKKEAFAQWHSLAMISSQLGDFCCYFNCTNKFLSLVNNVIDEQTDKTVDDIKMDVYLELATMLYKYYPDKIIKFLETILANYEAIGDEKKIKEIANKLVQSCLMSGNYNNALDYIGKIISRTAKSSFNPKSSDFKLNYYLMNLVTLEIYFNLGRLNECIELGEELFEYVDISAIDDRILPDGFSKKQFEDTLLDALFYINLARIIQLKSDRKEKLQELISTTGAKYSCLVLLDLLDDFFAGKDILAQMNQVMTNGFTDKYSTVLFPILQAYVSMLYQDWTAFGNYFYNAKINAVAIQLHQVDAFCDLMIGFAYQNLNNLKKAKQIYYNILDIAAEKGLKNISYLSWYFISRAEYFDGVGHISEEIVSKSILKMENDSNCSELFELLFKVFSAQIMLEKNNPEYFEQIVFTLEQAFSLALKKQIYLNLPIISDALQYVYNAILSMANNENTVVVYRNKIDKLNSTMSKLFQRPVQ